MTMDHTIGEIDLNQFKSDLKEEKMTQIRQIEEKDFDQWKALWRDYLNFYQTILPEEVTRHTFKQMLREGVSPYALVAVSEEGDLIGFAHYLFHCTTWEINPCCYLQDLFVVPSARGNRIGELLMEEVHRRAKKEGASFLHWLTNMDNSSARRLYDRVGNVSSFIRYKWNEVD